MGGRWNREVKWYVIQNSVAIVTQTRLLAGQGVKDGEEPNLSLGKEGLERPSLFARFLYLPAAIYMNDVEPWEHRRAIKMVVVHRLLHTACRHRRDQAAQPTVLDYAVPSTKVPNTPTTQFNWHNYCRSRCELGIDRKLAIRPLPVQVLRMHSTCRTDMNG